MLKKTITYSDLDGNPVTEDFYFNLSKAEIAELEIRHDGGFTAHLQKIIDSADGGAIIDTFKNIIRSSVGRRSEDGRRFVKSEEITNEFLQTDAYSELFMELVTDAEAAGRFVEGIVPADLSQAAAKLPKKSTDVELPAYIVEDREPTQAELQAMTNEELQEAFRRKAAKQIENLPKQDS